MLNQEQNLAKNLYLQTNLSKTQIADLLKVSRRSLHYWIKENNWERMKKCSSLMPSMLIENCYHILHNLQRNLLSQQHIMRPATYKDADTMHKIMLTVGKLQKRTAMNESMEMMAYFMEGVEKQDPALATKIMPHVEVFIARQAATYPHEFMPAEFDSNGLIEHEEKTAEQKIEEDLDLRDFMSWTESGSPTIDVEQLRQLDDRGYLKSDATTKKENELRDTSLSFGEGRVPPTKLAGGEAPLPKTTNDLREESAATFFTTQSVDGTTSNTPNNTKATAQPDPGLTHQYAEKQTFASQAA